MDQPVASDHVRAVQVERAIPVGEPAARLDDDRLEGRDVPGVHAVFDHDLAGALRHEHEAVPVAEAALPIGPADQFEENPGTPEPKPEDLAVPFFVSYSQAHPATFPAAVERKGPNGGKIPKGIEPVEEGSDIQGTFFDMWLQEHPKTDLEPVPADMVMASGSGLDPHITLKNALYQLDRVAATWAADTKRDLVTVRKEIEELLHRKKEAPLMGLAGVDLVNVLEVNLALREAMRVAVAK